jgi:hypothetical protein
MVAVEGDEQNRRCPAASSRLPGSLQRPAGWLPGGIDRDHLDGILAVPDVERLGVKPDLARKRQGPGHSLRKKRSVQNGTPPPEASYPSRNLPFRIAKANCWVEEGQAFSGAQSREGDALLARDHRPPGRTTGTQRITRSTRSRHSVAADLGRGIAVSGRFPPLLVTPDHFVVG